MIIKIIIVLAFISILYSQLKKIVYLIKSGRTMVLAQLPDYGNAEYNIALFICILEATITMILSYVGTYFLLNIIK